MHPLVEPQALNMDAQIPEKIAPLTEKAAWQLDHKSKWKPAFILSDAALFLMFNWQDKTQHRLQGRVSEDQLQIESFDAFSQWNRTPQSHFFFRKQLGV